MIEKSQPKRVLHIVSSMDRGGAETLIMNIFRNIDRSKIQFDFVTHNGGNGDFNDEIHSLGGVVYNIPSLGTSGPIVYLRNLIQIMSPNHYIAIHSHTDYQSGFPTLAAKIKKIPIRICHSHSTDWLKGNGYKEKVTLKTLQTVIKLSATNYCSCSPEAGSFLFGQKAVDQLKVEILNNGIDVNEFTSVNENSKEVILKELNLPDETKVIGHVGRFSESKNHLFILNILKRLVEQDKNYIALLVGEGPMKEKVKEAAEKLGVLEYVRFLGVRKDIPVLMKAFDVFLFPSFFEGFGIVTLEAQSAGTYCVVSDQVPKTTDMGLQLISYLSLNEDTSVWIEEIKKIISRERPDNKTIHANFRKCGFHVEENIPTWLTLYGVS